MAKHNAKNKQKANQVFVNQTAVDVMNKVSKALFDGDANALNGIKDDLIHKTGFLLVTLAKCPHVLHAVCYLLLSEDFGGILKQMAPQNVTVLKECVSTACGKERPDEAGLKNFLEKSEDKIVLQSVKISLAVKDLWDYIVTELAKWDAQINMLVKENSVKSKSFLTIQELVELLGLASVDVFYCRKVGIKKKHPEIEDWFDNFGNKGKLFKMEHLDELKQLFETEFPNKETFQVDENKWWPLQKMAEKLGMKDKYNVGDMCRHIVKKHPELKEKIKSFFQYFPVSGTSQKFFNAEHFDEFQSWVNEIKSEQKKLSVAPVKAGKQEPKKSKKTGDAVAVAEPPLEPAAPVTPNKKQRAKKTLVEVIAMEKRLDAWMKMLQDAKQEHDAAKQQFYDVLHKVQGLEPGNAGMVDALNDLSNANAVVESAVEHIQEISGRIDKVKTLDEAKRNAEEAKRNAEEAKRNAEEAKRNAEEAERNAERALVDAEREMAELLKQGMPKQK